MLDADFTEDKGSISTDRHEDVRWRYGEQEGFDLFEEGMYFDGLALVIECGSRADADAMLAAISKTPIAADQFDG